MFWKQQNGQWFDWLKQHITPMEVQRCPSKGYWPQATKWWQSGQMWWRDSASLCTAAMLIKPAQWWGSRLVSVNLSKIHLLCPFHASSPLDLMALTLWQRILKGESISYPDSSVVARETLANRDCSAPLSPAIVTTVTLVSFYTVANYPLNETPQSFCLSKNANIDSLESSSVG